MSAHNFTVTRSSNRKHLIAVIDGPNMSSLGKRSNGMFSLWTDATVADFANLVITPVQ